MIRSACLDGTPPRRAPRDVLSFVSALVLAVALAPGCKAYDAARIETSEIVGGTEARCGDGIVQPLEACDTAIAPGMSGACPQECHGTSLCQPSVLVGADCQQRCMERVISVAARGDGCCPPGVGPADDPDCVVCGDGIVSPGEGCDPAVEGSCAEPSSCVSNNPCVTVTFAGSAEQCNARCIRREITVCQDGDRCCPIGCDAEVDGDCSKSCGDGRLDLMVGETCDTNSTSSPCPMSCDDRNPSTRDRLTGEHVTCTAVCEHMPEAVRVDGDGICAPGSTAIDDSDCKPVCGNGLVEDGEVCDGGEACDTQCRMRTKEGLACIRAFAQTEIPEEACKACSCTKCASTMLGCYASEWPDRNDLCVDVVECATRTGCRGRDCLCRGACSTPDGACFDELAAATGTEDLAVITRRAAGEERYSTETYYAAYYAEVYGACITEKCAKECNAPMP